MASTSAKRKIDFDPYQVLSLETGCTEAEVDRAYKKAALKWHPDKAVRQGVDKAEAERMFVRIYQAYEFLKDDTQRGVYDEEVAAKKRRQEFDDRRRNETSARRQHFADKLQARETAFETRHSKKTGAASAEFHFDKELERLKREGAEFLRRMYEDRRQAAQAPTPAPAQVPTAPQKRTIYNITAAQLKELEDTVLAGL